MEKFEIIWEAPEYDHHEKGIGWYWMSIIIAVLFLAIAVWQKNYLFACFIIVAEVLVIIWANRPPNDREFTVNEKGVGIKGHKFYHYSAIQSFHGIEREYDDHDELMFHLHGKIHPTLVIKVPKEHFHSVRKSLANHLPHIHKEESFADVLSRYLRF
jgi:hypothetical protein